MSSKLYKNLIGGEWVASRTGKTFLNINPANSDDIVGEFPSSAGSLLRSSSGNLAISACWLNWRTRM